MGLLIAILACLVTSLLHSPEPPAEDALTTQIEVQPPEARPDQPVAGFATAGDLLAALERADRDIRTFSSQIRYTRLFEIENDIQTRIGRLYFRTDPPAEVNSEQPTARRRWVAVRFEQFIAGLRSDKQEKLWVFDGQWLVEKDPVEKQFLKRRMVRPGQVFDPLRVGEGPFFVPVGQRREDMELYFTAALRPSAEGLSDEYDPKRDQLLKSLAGKLEGLIQLELAPKPGMQQVEDFSLIRIWYDPQTLLPRASLAVDRLGDVDVFELFAIDINETRAALPEGVFSVDPPAPSEGYHVEITDETQE
ncbi:MAG: hypothetical protein DYG94_04465 [Leptolyngbya sp. PLA3]|nr:MAG: hypothetical protein EDM82_07430 [Cyanobacteria bacterium CYA]MCE7967985.1 hypothetical protein [Leptolyngbya sp. PL-A3]